MSENVEADYPASITCSRCGGHAPMHDDAYVCDDCGDEWYPEAVEKAVPAEPAQWTATPAHPRTGRSFLLDHEGHIVGDFVHEDVARDVAAALNASAASDLPDAPSIESIALNLPEGVGTSLTDWTIEIVRDAVMDALRWEQASTDRSGQ